MQQVGYHRENILAMQLCTDMMTRDTQMLAMMQEHLTSTGSNYVPDTSINSPPQVQTDNAIIQYTMQLEMLSIQRGIQREFFATRGGDGGSRRDQECRPCTRTAPDDTYFPDA